MIMRRRPSKFETIASSKRGASVAQDIGHFGIQLPDPGLGEMPVGGLEKCVAIERIDLRRDAVEQALDQIAPPAFVVIRARLAGRGPQRHFLPDLAKGRVQPARIERQPLPLRDQRVMRPDAFR